MPTPPMPSVTLTDLCQVPQHRLAAARLVHDAFWTDVPGASAERMAARLALASRTDRIPLCLLALAGDDVVAVANLVENDDDTHTDWTPWLAGVVVRADWRGCGVGSLLVRHAVHRAASLGVGRLYFGTSDPGFYTRLGAVLHLPVRPDFCFMRFDLAAPGLPEAGS
jgi:GNAT superfamily N-acetyltransferase